MFYLHLIPLAPVQNRSPTSLYDKHSQCHLVLCLSSTSGKEQSNGLWRSCNAHCEGGRCFWVVRHAFYFLRYILAISTSQKGIMPKSDTTIIGKFSYRVTWEAIKRGGFRTWGRRGLRGVSGLDTIVIQGHAARRLSGYYSLTSHGNTHPRWLTHPQTCDTAHHGELSPSFGDPTYWLGDLT